MKMKGDSVIGRKILIFIWTFYLFQNNANPLKFFVEVMVMGNEISIIFSFLNNFIAQITNEQPLIED